MGQQLLGSPLNAEVEVVLLLLNSTVHDGIFVTLQVQHSALLLLSKLVHVQQSASLVDSIALSSIQYYISEQALTS